jgi:hypothetical protein
MTPTRVGAQAPIFTQVFHFSSKKISVYELANLIKQQSDLSVSFDAKQLKSNAKIKLPKKQMTAKELAVLLTKEYNIESKFIGRHIILRKLDKGKAPKTKNEKSKVRSLRKQTQSTAKEKASSAPIEKKGIPAVQKVPNNLREEVAALEQTVYFTDTFTMSSTAVANYGFSVGPESGEISYDKHIERLDKPEIANINPYWYERFGLSLALSTDEYAFTKPSLNLHFAGLQMGVGYAVRAGLSHWQYELGYRHYFNETFALYLNGNFGNLPNVKRTINYTYDSIPPIGQDSIPQPPIEVSVSKPYELRTKRIQIGLTADYKLSERMDIAVGMSINFINTSILHNGNASAPNSFLPDNASYPESEFYVLPNSYTIVSDYSQAHSSFRKQSIGANISIRYYLFRGKRNID